MKVVMKVVPMTAVEAVERLARRAPTREAAEDEASVDSVRRVARLWTNRMAARRVVSEAWCLGKGDGEGGHP